MTAGPAYLGLSDEEQAEALRPVALGAAADFGLEVHRLELTLHAYNTTYAVETVDGQRFALRVNTNSTSPPEEVVAQQAWQLAIAEQTPVRVATPLRTTDGRWCAVVDSDALGREVLVTCASWLDGPDVVEPSPEVAHALGRTMALLHEHGRSWRLPEGARMPLFDTPLFGDPDRLGAADLDPGQREVLRRASAVADAAFHRAYAGAQVIPLHADLHGGNLKWHEGRLAVFDFDDCGLGVPALDLAISIFYLRGGDEAAETQLRAGYETVGPLPDISPDDLEALVAARQLLLANALLNSSTSQLREMARTYLPTSVDRLAHWLATGHFTRAVPSG
ncbi:phosphotransferase enzyme family protein [Ornithinimicrobium cavernae]|uniref:phosphotransferase enzyme family protein n=1 Tax=Ornithinimicrobium cavernae TaxID=2666047 RepID=UPI0013797F27|nr:phosphotransferase [Ornithinimicrobium cavernae]